MILPILSGRANARTQRTLALLTGWTVRDVQAAIEEARRNGAPICSGDEGVWLAETSEELAETYRMLRARIASQNRTAWALRRTLGRMRASEARVEQPDFGLVA